MTIPLACPRCRERLPGELNCTCGFTARRRDGIVDLMTPEQEDEHSDFSRAYERIRAAQGWGGDDLDLPGRARKNKHIWAIRTRTFRRLERFVKRRFPGGGSALDVGAGNCWVTGHLSRWGFRAVALDVNPGHSDGLATGSYHLERGSRFERVRAPMESLPFPPRNFDLVVAGASFHYSQDARRTLLEWERVLRAGGVAIIFDSPWYEHAVDGERVVAERVEDYRRSYDLDERLARRSSFLDRNSFKAILESAEFGFRRIPVWPGPARALEGLRARLIGHRVATFPLLVLERPS